MHLVNTVRVYYETHTHGFTELPDGQIIYTLERPWLDNKVNQSCVPEGEYLCKWLPRSGSGKYKRVWHVQNVEGRTGILWHSGNKVEHTLGCVLTGMSKGDQVVYSSLAALNRMRELMSGEDFIWRVKS